LYPVRKLDEPSWITYLRLQNVKQVNIIQRNILDFAPQYKIPHDLEWKVEAPFWKFKGNAMVSCFWDLGTHRIWILENLEHNWDILPFFKPGKDILYVIIAWHMTQWNFDFVVSCMKAQNPQFPLSDIIYLANTPEYIPMAYKSGMRAIYVNQNAFVDEHLFRILPEVPRKYNIIVNSRPEWWKRTILVRDIPNVAVIKGFVFQPDQVISLEDWVKPTWINQERIPPEEVLKKLNESIMGGIFSEEEGACFSSSEYLLCGLPVLTTKSIGGRDIWYTDENHIMVDDNTVSVREGWLKIRGKLMNQDFNRTKIRIQHILLQKKFRRTFLESIQQELKIRGITRTMDDIKDYFRKNFFHTMRRIILYDEAKQWIDDNNPPDFLNHIKPTHPDNYPFV
jgi:hypothetical protein